MDSAKNSFTILMFPWLAHGHIFPFLELAKRISIKKNFHIQFCTTSINFTSINNFIHKNSLQNSIELLELHLQPTPILPPHYHTTKNLPSHLIPALLTAFQTSKSSFSDVITARKPDLLIFDAFQYWSAGLASSLGIPAVHFSVVGAAASSYGYHHYNCWDDDFPFPELYLQQHEKKSLDGLIEFLYANVFDRNKDSFFLNFKLSSEITLVKTSKGLEGKYIDYVSWRTGKRILGVGPLVTDADDPIPTEVESSEILQWLSKKDEHSTVYVSFGSECFLSKEEIEEIAKGLELSRVNFIWIIRFPVTMSVTLEDVLPPGFLDRARDRGMVVSGWAPQASILAHCNIGGFVSHCGWSSLNESLYYGVPVIAMPMKINMLIDAKMLVGAGACVEVERGENGVFKGDEIAKAINRVIVEESREEMRGRARELSEKMRAEEEQAIDETAECLWQLCCKKRGKCY